MKIRYYLALMAAAILVPVIVLSTISLNMLLKAEREAALKGVRETARAAVISIERELTNTESALRTLASSPYLDSGELAGFYRQARFSDKAGITRTALLDENGQQLLDTAVPYGTAMPAPAPESRVAKVLQAGAPQVSNLIRGADGHALQVMVDVPLTTASGRRYVIEQGFRVEHFRDVLVGLNTSPAWLAGVFDRNGMTIARKDGTPEADGDEPQPDLREAIRSEKVGMIRNSSNKKLRLYTVLERSPLAGWTVAVGVPEADIEAAARQAVLLSVLGLIAALACATMAAVFFARRLARSIGAVAHAARALGRGEAISAPAVSGVVEVDEVQAAIAEAAHVVCLEKQSRLVAEAAREQLFASEHAARTMAERQNRAKDEFLAMLGHELRNPLAAIVNAVSLMSTDGARSQSVRRAHEIVYRQSRHLSRIVDDLLDVGRVQSGKILLERCQLRFDTLVQTYLMTLRETGRLEQHAVRLSIAPAWVTADPTRLEQIVANLLDNALKYTPVGGSIAVEVRADGEQVVLYVSDSGAGIAPELMPYVFDLFVQGARALDRPQGGLGVGLALVRRLAELHEGSVVARSAGTGLGSTFELRLPLLHEPDLSEAPRVALQASGQSVLLVEDNQDGREMMEMMLSSHSYQVVSAADGHEGLRRAVELQPAIALVDIGLPGMDGYEVARRLRADPRTCAVRLIALTGYGQESDQQRAIDAGFDMHLVKPVELDVLIAALETRRPIDVPA